MDVQGDRCLQEMLKKDLHLRRKQQHRRGCWCWWRGRRRRSEELEMDEDEEGLLRRGRGSVVCRKREKRDGMISWQPISGAHRLVSTVMVQTCCGVPRTPR